MKPPKRKSKGARHKSGCPCWVCQQKRQQRTDRSIGGWRNRYM